jgi:hypothetical protein
MPEHFYTYPVVIELRREEPRLMGAGEARADQTQPRTTDRVAVLAADTRPRKPEPFGR